jgi:hypothetical protein
VTRLALIGGDDGLRDELVGVLRSLPALELLPGRGGEGAELLLVAGDDTLSAHDRCRTHAGVVPCVLVVDDAGDGEAARAAMAAGARAIVGRPLQAFELSRAADAARSFMTAAATGAPRGRVVVVTAGAGGVGVSTLTAALVGILPGPVAVLDLDPAGGVLAERLGVPVRSDSAGLAGEDSGRRAFERLAEHLPDGFLISSPPWPELAWTVREGVARELVEAAAAVCASVLVDAGRGVGPALEALQARPRPPGRTCRGGRHGGGVAPPGLSRPHRRRATIVFASAGTSAAAGTSSPRAWRRPARSAGSRRSRSTRTSPRGMSGRVCASG